MPIDDRRVTLKDIAEKTGFTVNTVSQALRGSPKLREETKAAIRAAAKELGYVHNALAGSLRSGSSRTIAIIVGDTSNLRFSIQLHAFELAFRTLGYQVIVMNTDETAQYELDAVKNAVRSSVDGVLLCPCQKSRAAIDLLESCRTPYVLFGRCYDDLPAVIWDDERGGSRSRARRSGAHAAPAAHCAGRRRSGTSAGPLSGPIWLPGRHFCLQ